MEEESEWLLTDGGRTAASACLASQHTMWQDARSAAGTHASAIIESFSTSDDTLSGSLAVHGHAAVARSVRP